MIFQPFDAYPSITLGRQNDNNAIGKVFPIAKFIEEFGAGGNWYLLNQRPGETREQQYAIPPSQLIITDETLTWVVSSYDVEKEGHGRCELAYYIDDVRKMDVIYTTCVEESMVDSGIVPDPWQAWLDQLDAIARRAEDAADRAEAVSVHSPYIGENGNWFIWSTVLNAYVDSGQSARPSFTVVGSLPETGQAGIIYLVPKGDPETGDVYDEYVWANSAFELIGTTAIDLTGYATEQWVIDGFLPNTIAIRSGSGQNSILEGGATSAAGYASHAEGYHTTVAGGLGNDGGHAEGSSSQAAGRAAHAEGSGTAANGRGAHSEGWGTKALADASHSEGAGTIANTGEQHVQGRYNVESTQFADIVGNGSSNDDRKNIEVTTWTGDKRMKGDVYTQCNDDSTGGKKLATEEYVVNQGFLTNIPDGSVTNPKIADDAVTNSKLGEGSVESGKIANGAVTNEKVSLTKLNLGGIAKLFGNYAAIIGGRNSTVQEWTGIGSGQVPGPAGAAAAAIYAYGGNYFMSIESGNTEPPPSTISGSVNDYSYWLPVLFLSGTVGGLIVGNGSVGASRSVSFGQGCSVLGNQSIAQGSRCLVTKTNSQAFGAGLIVDTAAQFACGSWNIPVAAKFIIGNGTSRSARKNIVLVDTNGDLHLAGAVYVNASSADATDGVKLAPIPEAPTGDGNYALHCQVTNGVPLYYWA